MKALKEKEDARTWKVCFWVKVAMAKPSFDIFLFDRLDRYDRWDRKSWDQYVVSLDPIFFWDHNHVVTFVNRLQGYSA